MRHATVAYRLTPAAFKGEKRDCAVRALRCAACLTYEEAHRLLAAYGRVAKRATYNRVMRSACAALGLTPIKSVEFRPTLAQFVRCHPAGLFVLRVNTHFLALVDGVVHDWSRTKTGARTRVVMAWGR